MGIKSATKSNEKYEKSNLVFSSKLEYIIIKVMDRNLRRLYNSIPPNNYLDEEYIPLLNNDVDIDDILDQVVNGIIGFYVEEIEEVKYKEKESGAFNKKFPGIMNFVYHTQGLINEDISLSNKRIKNRIIQISKDMHEIGVFPNSF